MNEIVCDQYFQINSQENDFAYILFNAAAFDGSKTSGCKLPKIDRQLANDIEKIGPPRGVDDIKNPTGYIEPLPRKKGESADQYCYSCFMKIRDNIIHANKARWAETSDRREELFSWAKRYVEAVYATKSDFSEHAQFLKEHMGIKHF
ncbi:hypothetical protein ACQU0X_22265 [Pseudovibrio ascidiaceicola]|uniref:hypothetical protein n=1 Tax=Pseudovibrio ascidiaceicola TaxID=285279 RepID=UPI003D35B63F